MHVLPMIVPADNQVSLLKFYYFIFVYCFLNQLVSLLVHFFQEDQIFLFLCDCHLEGGASNLHHRGRRNRESSSGWSSSTKFNDIQMPILPFFIDRNKTLYHFYFEYKLNCMQKFEFIKFFHKISNRKFQQFFIGFSAHMDGRSRNDPVRQFSVRKEFFKWINDETEQGFILDG